MAKGCGLRGTTFSTKGIANAKTQGGREPAGKFEAQHRGIYTETTAGSGEDETGFKFPCYM